MPFREAVFEMLLSSLVTVCLLFLGLWIEFTRGKAVRYDDYNNGIIMNFELEFVMNPFRTENDVIKGMYPKYS